MAMLQKIIGYVIFFLIIAFLWSLIQTLREMKKDGSLVNNSPHITLEEWQRIHRYIAAGTPHLQIVSDESGTTIVFNTPNGFTGMMHPRAYLQMMEEDYSDVSVELDIMKHVNQGSLKLDI